MRAAGGKLAILTRPESPSLVPARSPDIVRHFRIERPRRGTPRQRRLAADARVFQAKD